MGTEEAGGDLFSRRWIVRGAAWSAPVLLLAVGTPLSAASPIRGIITFDARSYSIADPVGTFTILGRIAGVIPDVITLTYTTGFSGPDSIAMGTDTGEFTFTASGTSGPSTGTVTASAAGYQSAQATLVIVAA